MTTDGDGRVTRLELGANGLSGTLPAALGRLARLEALLLDGNVYLAGPLPAGLRELPALATVDLTDTELCAPEDAAFQDWTATISFSGLICPPESQTIIDVAVFYPPEVRDIAGGTDAIMAEIDLMAAETNRAYRDSGVNQRIDLVAVEELVGYQLQTQFLDLFRLQDPSDGYMDEVHTTRDRVAADIVVLISESRGIAFATLSPSNVSAANAFAISGRLGGSHTFAHELGHLMGLHHDRYDECIGGWWNLGQDCTQRWQAAAYAYGYVNQRAFDEDAPVYARWRTIMARDQQCRARRGQLAGFRCAVLMRFSNPDQVHPDPGGAPLGVAGSERSTAVDGPADAVRALNRTRATVASYRTTPSVTVSFGATTYTAAEGGPAATVTLGLSAAPQRPVSVSLLSMGATGATASDYTAPTRVTFAADETVQTFIVTAVDDSADDDGETVSLAFDASRLPSGMTVGSPAIATVTLADDDVVTAAPMVRAVALISDPGPDAVYALGEEIEATVRFDKSVTVTGTPRLGLTVGSRVRQARHRASAGEMLTFVYTVAEGDSDTGGVSIAADSLSGAIRDGANQAAALTHAAVAADAGHRVDGIRPVLQRAVADGDRLMLTYDEALSQAGVETGAPDALTVPDAFTVTSGGNVVRVENAVVTSQTVLVELSRSVLHGEAVTVSYRPGAWSIRDAAGTAAAAFSARSATNETAEPVYDTDHDGLIEITTLAQLDAVRLDLDGDGTPSERHGAAGALTYRLAFLAAFPDEEARLSCHGTCIGYELVDDLDFDTNGSGGADPGDRYWNQGEGWWPIGLYSEGFAATFEGNGHTIRHLFINLPNISNVGLFADFTGSIRSVGVIDVDVMGKGFVGGLLGRNWGTIAGSYVTGRVSGEEDVGGLVGQSFYGAITGSYATGEVSGETRVGGLVGDSYYGAITGSYATGEVSGEARVGGLVGRNRGAVTVSYATGRISGRRGVGGLVGDIEFGSVTASYATGPVSGEEGVGGLVGRINVTTGSRAVTASYATGPVSGEDDVGPLVGCCPQASLASYSYWDTTTSGHATSPSYTQRLGTGKSTEALQGFTSWRVDVDGDGTADDPWDFGASDQYPALKADVDGDGTATWQEFGRQVRAGPAVTATSSGGVSPVDLTWTSVDTSPWTPAPPLTYAVYRTAGDTVERLAAGLDALAYRDTTVAAGATPTYQVAAEVAGGEAARSGWGPVTVQTRPNRGPEAVGALGALTLRIADGAATLAVSGAFLDPDGDPLTYAASSSAPDVATVEVAPTAGGPAASTLTLTPLSPGETTVTVTATDAGGSWGTATQSFRVTVPNRSPVAVGVVSAVTLRIADGAATLAVSGAFLDPDGDPLTYAASSSAPGVATVEVAPTGGAAAAAAGGPSGSTLTLTPLSPGETTVTVTATDAGGSGGTATQSFRVTVPEEDVDVDYDADDDGLIEILTLAQLDAVRHDLDGDGVPAGAAAAPSESAGSGEATADSGEALALGAAAHAAAFPDAAERMGCPAAGCLGYELAADLDFDTDGSGAAGPGDAFWNGGAGWRPLGTLDEPFTAVFSGNGRTVSHLFVAGGNNAGLFGMSSGVIRGVGVLAADVTGNQCAGALLGLNGGRVEASWSTGAVTGDSCVGGLVGVNGLWVPAGGTFRPLEGFVTASWSAADVTAEQWVGGLVGYSNGTVAASYATGDVTATTDGSGAGGLVGRMGFGDNRIAASYATGAVSGPGGSVGGLVGHAMPHDRVTASYWDTETSGLTESGGGAAQTTTALQEPTEYSGLYAAWDVDVDGDGSPDAPWDFGTTSAYPALSVDVDGDGAATWQEFGLQGRAVPPTAESGAGGPPGGAPAGTRSSTRFTDDPLVPGGDAGAGGAPAGAAGAHRRAAAAGGAAGVRVDGREGRSGGDAGARGAPDRVALRAGRGVCGGGAPGARLHGRGGDGGGDGPARGATAGTTGGGRGPGGRAGPN